MGHTVRKRNIHHLVFPHGMNKLKREIGSDDTVLDLGCGFNSPLQHCDFAYALGVDIFSDYIEASRKRGIHDEYIEADIGEVEFEPASYDVVLCTQVIEHFTHEDGEALLAKMEDWARRKVIVTTPNGFLPKDGCHDNEYQEHLSGWTIADLEALGYRVTGISGLKSIRADRRATFFWRRAFDISSRFTYAFPRSTFQLLAIKEK